MPELRQNPATKEWVIIAHERAQRPEDFISAAEKPPHAEYEGNCPFCPGNEEKTPNSILEYRPYGTPKNTPGWWVRTTLNKFPALVEGGSLARKCDFDFFRHMDGLGHHEVIIESPRHDLHLAVMDQVQVQEVFLAYRQRYIELSSDKRFEIVEIFKNHGKGAGTSLHHPHSQVIAAPVIPTHIRMRLEEAMRYYDNEGRCVFCDMIEKEKEAGYRIVLETDDFLCFEPFASRSPFETYILPKAHEASFGAITMDTAKEFAYITRIVLAKINKALKNPDYNFVISSSPAHEPKEDYYHWHLRIVPRITQVAGFEMGSGIYINTAVPEDAAKFLRDTAV